MTNHEQLARELEPERGLPCFVHHEAAGGQCERTATIEVYGLNFCEAHGEEARIGAALREHYEAGIFFERFNAEHVPSIKGLIGRELKAAATRLHKESPSDEAHWRALRSAYPPEAATELVRAHVRDYGEHSGELDRLLDLLNTIHTLMRIAYEDGATCLVELLECEREDVAAHAAVALEASKVPERQPG